MELSPFEVVVEPMSGYVRVAVTGRYTGRELLPLLMRIRDEGVRHDSHRVLVDSRSIPIALATIDKFDLATTAAQHLPRHVRVALLGHPATIDGFGENVARNRGADVRVFTEEAPAVAWLLDVAGD